MGSPLRLQLHLAAGAEAGRAALSAWWRVSDEFEAAEQAMSRFRADSEVTLLNGHAGRGRSVPVSRRLYSALATAERAHRLTEGRFDPRVLADLERLGYGGAPLPGTPARPPAIGVASGVWLEREPRRRVVRLSAPVDLGGIGKGLALRWAWAALRSDPGRDLLEGALLDAGGDIRCGGRPLDAEAWTIGIEDPSGGEGPLAAVRLRHGAVCTSSVRLNRWTAPDGRAVHHLLDPRTGEPGGEGLMAVTVAGADPAWAEIWSKTLFLLGRRSIGEAARARGLAAWWVDADRGLSMTPAARLLTAWSVAG